MSGDLVLRMSSMQACQLQMVLQLAEHHAATGTPCCSFVAQQGTEERYAFIDLQLEVENLNAIARRER